MYYKIINAESKVFQELRNLREKELKIESENRKAIAEKVGLEWNNYLGHSTQQNFRRVEQYAGFEFINKENVDPKIWVSHKEHSEVFVPNKKTKLGREMYEFLQNGLKGSRYDKPYEILGITKIHGRFTLPFVHCFADLVLLYIDDKYDIGNDEIIEITKKEFNTLLNN